jgi:sugar phosphate isomerase/epimerase
MEDGCRARPTRAWKRPLKATDLKMIHSLSTHLFVQHHLTTSLLARIQKAGVEAVEIFCARQHLDWRDTSQLSELAHWFRDSELRLHSLHSPMYTDEYWGRGGPNSIITLTEPVKSKRLRMVDEIKRAIEVAERIPFRYLIQHLGVGGEEFDLRKFDAAFAALEELTVFARQHGVEILLENIPNALSSAERLLLFEETTHIGLNYAFDVGHAHMHEGVEHAFNLLKERIRSTHVHDNNGQDDLHLFPGAPGGTVDWKQTMELLRGRGDRYPLLLELRESPDSPHPLEAVKEAFDRLESL